MSRDDELPDRVISHSDMLVASMRTPKPGDWICPQCFGVWDRENYSQCRCLGWPQSLEAVIPISYALGLGQLHDALRHYKDGFNVEVRMHHATRLAAVLWRFLAHHLDCAATAAGVRSFDRMCVVPSRTLASDDSRGNLRLIVNRVADGLAIPFARLLRPVADFEGVPGHQYVDGRFEATEQLDGEAILLIDDTWTTGANALAAGAALKAAGATAVALVVLGRFVRDDWSPEGGPNGRDVMKGLPPFNWDDCALGVHDRPSI